MKSALIFFSLLLIAPLPAAAQGDVESDIVVTARKFNQVSLTLGHDAADHVTCSLNSSSGDTAIDSAMCERASRCMSRHMPSQAKLDACIEKQRKKLIALWARGQRT